MTIELQPNGSQVVGVQRLSEMYGKGIRWARDLLREWWQEQQQGGEVRVFRRAIGKHGYTYATTMAVLHRHMPPARDEALVRAVASLEKDLDRLTRAYADLLERVKRLERAPPRRP